MNKAVFEEFGTQKVISPRDISTKQEYKKKYQGKLFCPVPGCGAALDYVEWRDRRIKKIFRTHKGSEHKDTCPYCVIHEKVGGRIFTAETFSQEITLPHIKDVLRGLNRRNEDSGMESAPSRKKSISKLKKNGEQTLTKRVEASIDPDAPPTQQGTKEPSVKKRHIKDLGSEDIQKVRGVYADISRIRVGENYIELYDKNSGTERAILFYNAFRDKSQQAYWYLRNFANILKKKKSSLYVCVVGVVESQENRILVQAMDPEHVTIEGMSIYNFMALWAA